MTEYPYPTFIVGDNAKALRVTVRDKDGVLANLSGGSARLFAKCIETGDTPASGAGIVGTFPNGGVDGVVDFPAIGTACTLTSGRQAQLYYYDVKVVTTVNSYSDEGHFILRNHV